MWVEAREIRQDGIGTWAVLPDGQEVRLDEALEKLGIELDLTPMGDAEYHRRVSQLENEIGDLEDERDELEFEIDKKQRVLRELDAKIAERQQQLVQASS